MVSFYKLFPAGIHCAMLTKKPCWQAIPGAEKLLCIPAVLRDGAFFVYLVAEKKSRYGKAV